MQLQVTFCTAMHKGGEEEREKESNHHRSSVVDISPGRTPNGQPRELGYVIGRSTQRPPETKRNCSRRRLGHGRSWLPSFVAFVLEYRCPCHHLHDMKLVIPVTSEALDVSTGRTRHLGFRAPNGDLVTEVGPLIQDDTIRMTIRMSSINGQQEFN